MSRVAGDLWVFAYGSLMWQPGFSYAQRVPGLLKGYHRDFCIASLHYRGTRLAPGLVLGLDRGGTCRGVAYKVSAEDRGAVLGYLRKRELIYGVYREAFLPVQLEGETSEEALGEVMAVTYVAERCHPSYCGRLPLKTEAAIIRRARGLAGTNLDYARNTLVHLKALGIRERRLERLLVLAGGLAGCGADATRGQARSLALSRAWAAKGRCDPLCAAGADRHRFSYRKPRGA